MKNKSLMLAIGVIVLIAVATTGTAAVSYIVYTNNLTEPVVTDTTSTELPFEQDLAKVGDSDLLNHAEDIQIDATSGLTTNEIADLTYMREEEKLAHDVYTALYDKWGLNIFNNISNSEQTHTDSLKTLLDIYNLEDPFINEVGVFKNTVLQGLYTTLVNQGSVSVTEALKVGALIEDLDIVDLENAMERTEQAAILSVYENLQRGSRNHIRSFTQTLGRYGETYTPTYLTQAQYLEILAGATETGSGSGTGNGSSNGNGKGNN